jgi:hypothetical protein
VNGGDKIEAQGESLVDDLLQARREEAVGE